MKALQAYSQWQQDHVDACTMFDFCQVFLLTVCLSCQSLQIEGDLTLTLILVACSGSYPAISTRYSRDLRHLIDACLRHNPRDRPSVNTILRLPFIQEKIEKFLSGSVSWAKKRREGEREREAKNCMLSLR